MKLTLLAALAVCPPAHAQWSTDSLSVARSMLGAETVGSKALFVSGTASASVDVVDVYDAATGTWTQTTVGAIAAPGAEGAAAAGGIAMFTGFGPHVLAYDDSTGTWSVETIYTAPGGRVAAGTSDKIVFAGGDAIHYALDDVAIYDVGTGTWTTDFLSAPRHELAATGVGDLALFGGGSLTTTHDVLTTTVDILDTRTLTWSVGSLSSARKGLVATSVGGKALFAGGRRPYPTLSSVVDIYDAATGTWSQANLSQARTQLVATSVGPFALFAGGYSSLNPFTISDRVDIYDSRTGAWSTASLSVARYDLAATATGQLALFGGGRNFNGPSDVVDVFEAETGTMYCLPTTLNSAGLHGITRAMGSVYLAVNDLSLIAEQLPPGQFGYFITSLTQGQLQPPGSQGAICLSGNIGRYNRAGEIIQGPSGSLQLDLTSLPVNPPVAALPGDTWNFQCWYRDVNPAATSNTTNGLAVTFATSGDPSVQFAVTQASLVEDATLLEVRITLSQVAYHDVLVPWSTAGTATVGADWRVEELNPLTIPAGSTGADMTLIVAEDLLQEPAELAVVTLGAPLGAVLGTATTFTLTIVDDD